MPHQINQNRNFMHGGGGGVALLAVAAGTASLIDLFSLAPPLLGLSVLGVFLLMAFFYSAVDRVVPPRSAQIKALLSGCIVLALLVDPLAVRLHLLRVVTVDVVVVVLFTAALIVGLWDILLNSLRIISLACIALLVIAPWTEAEQRDEDWEVRLRVLDQDCRPMISVPVACEAAALTNEEWPVRVDPAASLTDSEGERDFSFPGNAFWKGAICYAFRPALGADQTVYPMRTTRAFAPFFRSTRAQIRLLPGGAQAAPADCAS